MRKNNFTTFIAITFEANDKACKFYKKMGFNKMYSIMSDIDGILYPDVVYLAN